MKEIGIQIPKQEVEGVGHAKTSISIKIRKKLHTKTNTIAEDECARRQDRRGRREDTVVEEAGILQNHVLCTTMTIMMTTTAMKVFMGATTGKINIVERGRSGKVGQERK